MNADGDIGVPIWVKLTAFAGLLIVPTALVGAVLMDIASETLKSHERAYRLALAEDISETIESELKTGENALFGVGRMLSNPSITRGSRISLSINIVESSELLDHVGVFDQNGENIDDIVQREGGPPVSLGELSEQVRRRADAEGVTVEGVVAGDEEVRVLMVAPIRAQGRTTGYVASYVPLRPIQKRVSAITGRSGKFVYVVDHQLQAIAHPDKSKALRLEPVPGNHMLENIAGNEIGRRAAQTGEFTDESGRRMLGSVQPMAGLPWAVVVEEPLEVAYASLYRMRWIVWGATGLALTVAVGLAFLLGRRLTRPIDRLVDKARQLADRRFDEQVEIGTDDELAVLGKAMNRAGWELRDSEEKLRREVEIRSDLGRYLPGDLVEGIVSREQSIALGGTRREVTVLFADVVRFTPMCEKLEPEAVVSILNELFTILTEIVFRHDGTVDKFIGDSQMAFWGAPRSSDDHAGRALEAAEDMLQWLEVGNARWQEAHGVTIELAVGVHTGEAIVGNVGSESRMEYTAVGRNVNIAARLEALANPQQILTTPATRRAAGAGFEMREIGPREVDTDGQAVEVLEVVV
jgi:class 3 adenylate cyclase